MKKAIAMLVTLTIVMTAGFSLAAVEVESLRQVVDSQLKASQWQYSYDEDAECFELTFNLDCTLSTVETVIWLYDDMVSVTVDCPIRIPEEHMEQLATFITLVNNDIYYAQFRLDMENGYLSCRSCNVIETVLPGTAEIDTLLTMPLVCMERYGDAIASIVSADIDPYAAYQSCAQE